MGLEKSVKPKKTARSRQKQTVIIESENKKITTKQILDLARNHYLKENSEDEIKTIEVYIKPEEKAAYYVVNGIGCDSYKVIL